MALIYLSTTGFLYGWTFFTVIECGTIAAVAVGFGKYLGTFIPWVSESNWLLPALKIPAFHLTSAIQLGPYNLGLTSARLSGIAIVVLLTFINRFGVRLGSRVQNVFTLAKIGSLAALVLAGLFLKPTLPANAADYVPPAAEALISLPFLLALLVTQTNSLFSADAWNSITFIAGEVKEPKRTIPLSLLIGTTLVCGLYFLANYGYLRLLGPTGIAAAPNGKVGSAAVEAIFGSAGGKVMAAAILVSMFGCVNGLVLAGARVYQTMATDGLFLSKAAELNRHGVPGFSLAIQAVWTCLLTMSTNPDATPQAPGTGAAPATASASACGAGSGSRTSKVQGCGSEYRYPGLRRGEFTTVNPCSSPENQFFNQ